MDEQSAWGVFTDTGDVVSYLIYRRAMENRSAQKDSSVRG